MYTNDLKCLTTSMNLHDYSLREDIEAGILTEFRYLDIATGLLSFVSANIFNDSLDAQAMEFVEDVVKKSSIHFEKRAKKDSTFFGLFNSYKEGEITSDKSRTGFCIRTRQVIALNPAVPYSKTAYDVWRRNGANRSYAEKYCHKCGEETEALLLSLFVTNVIKHCRTI